MSNKSRRKGARTELAIVHLLQDRGFAAEKVSGMYKTGPDLSIPLLGRDLKVEVKCRGTGFRQIYGWLDGGADLLIIKCDRHKPLVVLGLEFAAEIAALAEKSAKRIPAAAGSVPGESPANSETVE